MARARLSRKDAGVAERELLPCDSERGNRLGLAAAQRRVRDEPWRGRLLHGRSSGRPQLHGEAGQERTATMGAEHRRMPARAMGAPAKRQPHKQQSTREQP